MSPTEHGLNCKYTSNDAQLELYVCMVCASRTGVPSPTVTPQKEPPRERLELSTYGLTVRRAANCAIQESYGNRVYTLVTSHILLYYAREEKDGH